MNKDVQQLEEMKPRIMALTREFDHLGYKPENIIKAFLAHGISCALIKCDDLEYTKKALRKILETMFTEYDLFLKEKGL